jgi:hypothetical protein
LGRELREHLSRPLLGLGKDDASSQYDETEGCPARGDGGLGTGRDEGVAVERVSGGVNEVARDGEECEGSDEGLGSAKEVLELAGRSVDGVEMDVSNEGKMERGVVSEGGATWQETSPMASEQVSNGSQTAND